MKDNLTFIAEAVIFMEEYFKIAGEQTSDKSLISDIISLWISLKGITSSNYWSISIQISMTLIFGTCSIFSVN